MKKIAFCFLIYDEINHEELWNMFFQDIDTNKYSIYIHYKTNKTLKYFEQHKLANCIETKYCDVTIIHAHNLLFKKALEDGCDKIISLSQACIPLKSFDYIYDFLTKDANGTFVKLNTDKVNIPYPIRKLMIEEFNKILHMLDFNRKGIIEANNSDSLAPEQARNVDESEFLGGSEEDKAAANDGAVVAAAPGLPASFYQQFQLAGAKILFNCTYDILANAELAIVTSGTATLETALFNVPQVVCYKANTLSVFIARLLSQLYSQPLNDSIS
jgi:hypothetical protein